MFEFDFTIAVIALTLAACCITAALGILIVEWMERTYKNHTDRKDK